MIAIFFDYIKMLDYTLNIKVVNHVVVVGCFSDKGGIANVPARFEPIYFYNKLTVNAKENFTKPLTNAFSCCIFAV